MSRDGAADLAMAMGERRREVKDLCDALGRTYEEEVAPYRDVLRAAQAEHGCGVVEAALAIQRELEKVGKFRPYIGALLLAATFDVAEGR